MQKSRHKPHLAIWLGCCAMALAGCSTPPPKEKPDPSKDPALVGVDRALERSRVDVPAFTAISTEKPAAAKESGASLSFDYAGDALVLLARLAAANTMKFNVYGPRPYLPLFVVVNVKDADLHYVLKDIGEQFGERADLVLKDKQIEVYYRVR